MKRIIFKFILILIFLMCVPQRVYAQNDNGFSVDNAFELVDEDNLPVTKKAEEISKNGFEISVSSVFEKITDIFASELKVQCKTLKKIAAISILCGFLSCIGEAFGKKEVSETGFFVCLTALIYMVMSVVNDQCAYVYEALEKITDNFKISVPVFGTAAVFAGRTAAPVMLPVMTAFSALSIFLAKNITLPFIEAYAVLECINCIGGREILTNLCELIKKVSTLVLKISAFAFTAVLSLQRLVSSQGSALMLKTAKNAVGAVPVVGDIMKSSAETAVAFSSAINNSLATAAAVLTVTVIAVPIMKLALMWLIYKLSAAFMEPITDKRVIKALNCAGDVCSNLIAVLFTVSIAYIVCIFIMLICF